jgi:hypothetical protein
MMEKTEQMNFEIDNDIAKALRGYIIQKTGKYRGELSIIANEALREYLEKRHVPIKNSYDMLKMDVTKPISECPYTKRVIMTLKNEGLGSRDIATKIGRSKSAINNWLAEQKKQEGKA